MIVALFLIQLNNSLKLYLIMVQTISSVAAMRLISSPVTTDIYYLMESGKEGSFYYNSGSAIDNTGVIIVPVGGGYFERIFDGSTVYPEWFGAAGDGVTDDTTAIQNAINYLYGVGGGELKFRTAFYSVSSIDLKRNVSLIGSAMYPSNSNDIVDTTVLVANTTGLVLVSYPKDQTYPDQTGEESLLPKSNPNLMLQDISFDGNYLAVHSLEIKECWGIKVNRCRIVRSYQYSLHLFDNNNIDITDCQWTTLLSLSNADYNVLNCEACGNQLLPPYLNVISANGVNSNNKIYGSPYQGNYYASFPVTAIDNTGLFTTSTPNILSVPGWQLSGAANGSFTYNSLTKTLTETVINSQSYRLVTNLPPLISGNSYTITGNVYMDPSSVNSGASIDLKNGNESLLYTNITAISGSIVPINYTFTYVRPAGSLGTNPLKIIINTNSSGLTGTDIYTFTDMVITDNNIATSMNKMPVIIDFTIADSTNLRNFFTPSEAYFINWVTSTTFRLASSYYNYTNSIWAVPGASLTGLTDVTVSSPQSVLSLIGKNSYNNAFTGNKFEDIFTNCIQLRGAYLNSFSGNTLTKGDYSPIGITGVSLEYGASYNNFTSGVLSNRYQTTAFDNLSIAVNIDAYSGHNVFSGLSMWGAKQIDIYDNFIGTSDNQNIYSDLGDNIYIYKQRAIDYNLNNKRGYIFQPGNDTITNVTPLISNVEFTLHFNDVVFDNNTNDCILYSQVNPSTGVTGRLNIKRINSNNNLFIILEATVVWASVNNLILNAVPYDITIMRDMAYNWSVYVNGTLITPASTNLLATDVATSAGVQSYIGGFGIVVNTYSIKRFRYFTDLLSPTEIQTLFSGQLLNKNTYNVANLLDSITSGSAVIASATGVTVTNGTSGFNGGPSVDFTLSSVSNRALLAAGNTDNSLIDKTLRFSFYAKSSTVNVIAILRDEIIQYVRITSNYTKYSVVMKPDLNYQLHSTEAIELMFGIETVSNNESVFTPLSTGLINMDKIELYTGLAPATVDLDLNNVNNQTVLNNAGSTYLSWAAVGASGVQTTILGSGSGSAVFSQPIFGISYKKIIIFCDYLTGTATYSFPTQFAIAPAIITTNSLASSIITSLSATSVTVTGSSSVGFLILEGY